MKTASSPAQQPVNPAVLLKFAACLEAHGIHDLDVTVCRRQAPAPATPDVVAQRKLILLRDFGCVAAVLSTCAAALPPECAVGEPGVRGTLEVAERMLAAAIADLERMSN